MALDDLKEVIEKLQGTIATHHDYLTGKERRTRQVLIDPLLKAFGWDVSNPGTVCLEHNHMDYALMLDDGPVAVIEAKPLGNSLDTKVISQAVTYANVNNIPYIVVTNGDRWEMYEVFKSGKLEDKRLMEFELSKNGSFESVLQALRIWKPNLATGHPKAAMQPVLAPPDAGTIKDTRAEPPVDDSARPDADTMPPVDDGSSSTNQLYLEYWTALKSSVDRRDSSIKVRKPQPQCWMGFAVGRSGFGFHTWASKKKRYIGVGLTVRGRHGRSHFERLRQNKTEIERQIGAELEWQENPSENYIRLYRRDTNLEARQDWDRQHQWLYEQLEIFYSVFKERVKAL